MALRRYMNHMLCVSQVCDGEKKRKKGSNENSGMVSAEFSSVSAEYHRNKDSVVSIVLAGGMVELYSGVVPASLVMEKHPGLCLARPEVFKRPNESLVGPGEKLFPGEKFFLVPRTTVKKLKRKLLKKTKGDEAVQEVVSNTQPSGEGVGEGGGEGEESDEISGESMCSAKDFYVSKQRWSECFTKKGAELQQHQQRQQQMNKKKKKKKAFTPPIRKARSRQGLLGGWKPGLTSVQEVSP